MARPVITAANAALGWGQSVPAGTLFTLSDTDGDAASAYEFWDSGTASTSGYFSRAGVRQATGVELPVSAAALGTMQFVGGTAAGAETVWVRGFAGGEWSDWVSWQMTTSGNSPIVSAANRGVHAGQSVAASGLFTASDAEGNGTITQYQFWDEGAGAESGYFAISGARQAAGGPITVSAAQLSQTTYVGGAVNGAETVWVRANDGSGWGAWVSWVMSTGNVAPVATPVSANRSVRNGQSVVASTLFTVSDHEGDAITQYRFWDEGTAGSSGYFSLRGIRQVEGAGFDISAADLPDLRWVAGSALGSEVVWVRAHDGVELGPWVFWTMTSSANALPVVSAPNASANRAQALAASSLFSVHDADGDAITQYRFWDDGLGASTGYFSLGGVRQVEGTGFNVAAADLANLNWVGGSVAGSEVVWVRAHDGTDFGPWLPWNMTSRNRAPVASAVNGSVPSRQPVAAATLFSTTDPEGDPIGAYELWDGGEASTSGYFTVNGVRQTAKASIPVAAANLGNVAYVGGFFAAQEIVWVRAFDGFDWGEWVSWQMATTGNAPIATAANASVGTEFSVAASSLFSINDADGDAITRYEFWDDGGTAPVSGHFAIDGVAQASGVAIPVDAADLGHVTYVGGENPGSETVWVRAADAAGFGPWQSWTMNTTIRFQEVVGTAGNESYGVPLGVDKIYMGLGGGDAFFATSGDEVMLMGGTGSDNYWTGSVTNAFVIVYENGNSASDFIQPGLILGFESVSPDPLLATIDSRHLLLGDASSSRLVLVIDWQQPANRIETWLLGGDPEIVGSGNFDYAGFAQFVASLDVPNITFADLVEADPVGLAGFSSSVFNEMINFYATRENALASMGS